MSKKKIKEAPKTSPKHSEAELRRELFAEMSPIEDMARELLKHINKLRHGDLDYVSKLADMQDTADRIAEDLGTYGSKLKGRL